MTLQARTVLNLIAGALGGVLAWIVIDLTGWFAPVLDNNALVQTGDARYWLQLVLGGIVGAFVGLLLGLVDALSVDSNELRTRGLIVHTAVGFLGGALGIYLGQAVWAFMAPRSADAGIDSPGAFTQTLIARAFGWAFIGAGVGIAQGVARRSHTLTRQGLFGGLAGGLVGGVLFQSASTVIGIPAIARLLGFVCIGASTGFFIGLIQNLFRQAWIRVVLGRNEGKEYLIDKAVLVIGRSELADIGLFGNPKIMPHHCIVEQIQGRFRLRSVAAEDAAKRNQIPANVRVNGLVINPDVWLTDGDTIAIDDRTLQFRERLARKSEEKPAPPAAASPPKPSPAAVRATVKVIEGEDIGKSFAVGAEPAVIGRTEDSAIYLSKDTSISRRHATVQNTNNQWTITDCGSANGTFVNNVRLDLSATSLLKPGDHLRVGDTVLRIDF